MWLEGGTCVLPLPRGDPLLGAASYLSPDKLRPPNPILLNPKPAKPALSEKDVLQPLEGDYFLDYALFTGAVREYVVRSLEQQYDADKNDWHQRLLSIAVYREEYTAYEDLGAFLDAFLAYSKDGAVLPLQRVLNYRPARVRLKALLAGHGVATPEHLYAALKLDEWIPGGWSQAFPAIDLKKVLNTACGFFVTDCAANQKDYGVVAFNKIKHGLLVVPSAKRYQSGLPDAPGMFYPTTDPDDATENPVTLQAVPYDDAKMEQRLRVVHFIQISLRLLAFLHVLRRWPAVLESRGHLPPLLGFGHGHLRAVRDVAERVTRQNTPDPPESADPAVQGAG